MSLNYHIQELPPDMHDGEQKLYPRVETYTVFDNPKMVKRISMEAGVQEGLVMAVLKALPGALKNILLEGHTCKIDGLGSFSVSLSFGADGGVEVSRLNLKTDPEFLSALREEAELVKVQTEVVKVARAKGHFQEHYVLLKEWLDKHPNITLQKYAQLMGVSAATASRELKRMCADKESGISSKGAGAWKVWVKTE